MRKFIHYTLIFKLTSSFFAVSSVEEMLLEYQGTLVERQRKGANYDETEDAWTFAVGFLYSLTVITTIGE